MAFITKEQFEELENTRIDGTREEFHRLLEKYTDIVAHPFVSYIYAECNREIDKVLSVLQ